MRSPKTSLSTRTAEFEPRELPLRPSEAGSATTAASASATLHRGQNRTADRIKDALLRWLEEEL